MTARFSSGGGQRQHVHRFERTFRLVKQQILEAEHLFAAEGLGIDDDDRTVAGLAVSQIRHCVIVAQDIDLIPLQVEILCRIAAGRTVDPAIDVLFDRAVGRNPGHRAVFQARSPLVENQYAIG